MRNKVDSYLGLARRSGNLVTGYDTCIALMKKSKIKLLIITQDASEKTKDKFIKLSKKNNVKLYVYSTTQELSMVVGMANRSVFGIVDVNFANALKKELESIMEQN